jgi:hypothetical protein
MLLQALAGLDLRANMDLQMMGDDRDVPCLAVRLAALSDYLNADHPTLAPVQGDASAGGPTHPNGCSVIQERQN